MAVKKKKKVVAKSKSVSKKATKKVAKVAKAAPVPKGYHTATPHLTIKGAGAAIAWYQKAFGAKALSKMEAGGMVMHAEVKIGDSIVMMADENLQQNPSHKAPSTAGFTTGGVMLYVKDVDSWFKKAVAAGAKSVMEPADQFWGDRFGTLVDPFGHTWSLASRKVNMTNKQLQKATDDFMKQMQQQAPQQQAA